MSTPSRGGRPPIGPAFHMRVPQDLLDQLDALAAAQGITRALLIRRALTEFAQEATMDSDIEKIISEARADAIDFLNRELPPGSSCPGDGTIEVGLGLIEGHDAWLQGRDGGLGQQAVAVTVARDDDETTYVERRMWLPVHPDSALEDDDGEVFGPAFTALLEAIDAWLSARGLPVMDDVRGGYNISTVEFPADLVS